MNNKKYILLISIITIIVFIVSLLAYNYLMPKITLERDSEVININSTYSPINYTATYINQDVTSKVRITGIVDTSNMGEYPITYTLNIGPFKVSKTLFVKVIDEEPPIITLNEDSDFSVCSINSYVEPGYTAIDNVDGDVTNNVKVTQQDNIITYTITDSSNNTSSVTRALISGDTESPIIKLKGTTNMSISLNSEFKEPGYTATDNCDGNITDKVTVTGTVDTTKPATYTITYEVTDSKSNTTTLTRKVNVVESLDESNENGIIYLTFDDGPGTYTNSILDTLDKYNIKATFFVTNAGSDSIILREYQSGHTIGLHTATHVWSIYSSVDSYFDDLNIVSNRVKNITGYYSKYIRFPGGSSNNISKHYSVGIMSTLAQILDEKGYKYFDWNEAVEDAGACAKKGVSNRSSCVLDYFKKELKKNRTNMVLLHDIKSYTASSLEDMIKYALSEGYTFSKIDDNTPIIHQKIAN